MFAKAIKYLIIGVFSYSILLNMPITSTSETKLEHVGTLQEENSSYNHKEISRLRLDKPNDVTFLATEETDDDFHVEPSHIIQKIKNNHPKDRMKWENHETFRVLFESEKKRFIQELENLTKTIVIDDYRDYQNDLKEIQKSLKYFGYYEGEIDGLYGPLTIEALDVAEKELGLEVKEKVQTQIAAFHEQTTEEDNYSDHRAETNPHSTNQEKEKVETIEEKNNQVSPNTGQSNVIQVATSFIGTPYVWGGESPSGFDCSGFIHYVYQTQGIDLPRTVSEIWSVGQTVSSPSVGDFVFFTTYKSGPSHMGIYIGNGEFVHAGTSSGVTISNMNSSYWQPKYLGAKRIQ
ncbi:NlpC/P60 family protein [Oceanobacillus halophilus]|uniref:Cell wall lytic activity n=1 Tax=Oceanobacillus halophilus TaxID=930130 RepID=A0A495ACB2_9BACI|nr:NlpC/P60 family protein [Oceanobacillus halophilus]RKQ37619.1 cell wall lytic activity [Oceanobacillus halophilus]